MEVLSNLIIKQFFVFTMCMILVCIAGDLSANKGLEIAILSDKNNDGFIDSSSTMTMNLINKRGDVVTRKLRFKRLEVPTDGDKSIAIFESPRDVKGVAILSYAHKVEADDQWLYLPALKRVKRIASKNCKVLFEVPNAEYLGNGLQNNKIDEPHTIYFTRKYFENILSKNILIKTYNGDYELDNFEKISNFSNKHNSLVIIGEL